MRRSRDPESRYKDRVRREQNILEEYAKKENEWAEDLIAWYRLRKEEMPDDEYRAAAFFINREFLMKPGSLTLLYSLYKRLNAEMPDVTKENAFSILCYRFRVYALALEKGGF